MKSRNRSNVLLVEILIAVLFFMLSATVLMRVFATARNMTVRSGVESAAVSEAQNVAEAIYAADDVEKALAEMHFTGTGGAWTRNYGDYSLYVTGATQFTEAGELWTGSVSGFYNMAEVTVANMEQGQLFSLDCARYREVRP